MPAGLIHIEIEHLHPAWQKALAAEKPAARGIGMLDAPIFGSHNRVGTSLRGRGQGPVSDACLAIGNRCSAIGADDIRGLFRIFFSCHSVLSQRSGCRHN